MPQPSSPGSALVVRARPARRRRAVATMLLRIVGLGFLATNIAMVVTLLAFAGSAAGLVEPEADLVSGLRAEAVVATTTGLVTAAAWVELRRQDRQRRRRVVVDATGIVIAGVGAQKWLGWEDIAHICLAYTGPRDHVLWIETGKRRRPARTACWPGSPCRTSACPHRAGTTYGWPGSTLPNPSSWRRSSTSPPDGSPTAVAEPGRCRETLPVPGIRAPMRGGSTRRR